MLRAKKSVIFVWFMCCLLGPSIVPAETTDIAEGLYRNALNLLNQGLAEQALADFWKIVHLYPTSDFTDDALYLIGKQHFQTNEFEKSLEAVNQVINLYANGEWAPASYYLKAEIYMNPRYDKFDFKVAYANFSRIFSIYRDSEWVDRGFFGAGLAAFKMLDYNKAGELFGRVTEEFPESEWAAQAQYYHGMCYILTDQTLWAMQAFQKVIDLYPGSPFADKAKGLNTLIYKTRFLPEQKLTHSWKVNPDFRLEGYAYDDGTSLTINANGDIATDNAGEKVIYSFDVNGKLVKKDKTMPDLKSLSFDDSGDLIATGGSVVIVNGTPQKFFFQQKTEVEELQKMQMAICDREKNTYIVDGKHDGILKYGRDEKKVSKEWSPSAVKKILDMAFDFEGSLFIVNDGINAVQKFKTDGTEMGKIVRESTRYKIKSLDRVTCDPIGNIYILDSKIPAIFLFSRDLQFVQEITLNKRPDDFDVNFRGEIFVLNGREKKVEKFE